MSRTAAVGRPPLILPPEQWPEIDRRLWAVGCAGGTRGETGADAGDGLDDPGYAADVRPQTVINARKGWGRFLAVLLEAGQLDPAVPPSARVTRDTAARFIAALRDAGNKGSTQAARLFELRAALKVMEPDKEDDFAWLVRPGGGCAWITLGSAPRAFPVFGSKALFEWGLRLMDAVAHDPASRANRGAYRNGLIIAIFAARGLRLRSMAALELGTHLSRTGDGWQLELGAADMKNERRLGYGLSAQLTPYLDRYVDAVRPAFGAPRGQGPLWVIEGGGALHASGIDQMIRRLSRELTQDDFGSHTFRRAYGTSAALATPDRPAAAAAVLDISQGVAEKHYNLGKAPQAARQYHDALATARKDAERAAKNGFKRRS